jgi:ABC-type branched-subunit amino acid transport system permease subunit
MTASVDPVLDTVSAWPVTPRNAFTIALLVLLGLLPLYSSLTGDTFLVTLFTRVLILSIAAVSLNLIMGYGGMVSFGHAVYLGIGGCGIGALRAGGRCTQPAHAWRLFHYDHARVRADDLLRGDRT